MPDADTVRLNRIALIRALESGSPLVSEWDAATVAAHNELAAAYSSGDIDIPQPVDDNLWRLAKAVSRVSVRTVIHSLGTEEFYDMPIPAEFATNYIPKLTDLDWIR